jgi:hypothetical protein
MATRVSSYKSFSISATTSGPVDGGGYTGIFVIADIGDGGKAAYTWKGESATEKAALNVLRCLAENVIDGKPMGGSIVEKADVSQSLVRNSSPSRADVPPAARSVLRLSHRKRQAVSSGLCQSSTGQRQDRVVAVMPSAIAPSPLTSCHRSMPVTASTWLHQLSSRRHCARRSEKSCQRSS